MGKIELNSTENYVGPWSYVGHWRTNTRSGVGTRHGTIMHYLYLRTARPVRLPGSVLKR